MKTTISLLCLLLVLCLMAGCTSGESHVTEPSVSTTEPSVSTTEPTTIPATEPDTSHDEQVRHPYFAAVEEAIERCGFFSGSGILYDIDKNGIDELILSYTRDAGGSGASYEVCDIYTMVDNVAVPLLEDHNICVAVGGNASSAGFAEYNGIRYFYTATRCCDIGQDTDYTSYSWDLYTLKGTEFVLSETVSCHLVSTYKNEEWVIVPEESGASYNGKDITIHEYNDWKDALQIVNADRTNYFGHAPLAVSLHELLEIFSQSPMDFYGVLPYYEFLHAKAQAGDYAYSSAGNVLLYDIDGNGVEEMILTCDKWIPNPHTGEEGREYGEFVDIYTLKDGEPVPLMETYETGMLAGAIYPGTGVVNRDGSNYFFISVKYFDVYADKEQEGGTWRLYSVNEEQAELVATVKYSFIYNSEHQPLPDLCSFTMNDEPMSLEDYNRWFNSMELVAGIGGLNSDKGTGTVEDLLASIAK